ncbi:MAG: hypothetical protein HOC71_05005 [Candidatus Latescibacteria bacterium]|nr:hypothetical protein [Candidatus Latescibacterota bacterium]
MSSHICDFTKFCRLLQGIVSLLIVIAGCSQNEHKTESAVQEDDSVRKKEIPSYIATRTTGVVVIDGRLDEPGWERAEERVMVDAYTGGETPLKSTFRMLWDDSYLYVGVYFEDHDAWATYTEEDDPLW